MVEFEFLSRIVPTDWFGLVLVWFGLVWFGLVLVRHISHKISTVVVGYLFKTTQFLRPVSTKLTLLDVVKTAILPG